MIQTVYIFYSLLGLCVLLLFIPLPFNKPKLLHEIFGSGFGELVFIGTAMIFFFSIIGSSIWLVISWFSKRRIASSALKLGSFVAGLSIALIALIALIGQFGSAPERIYLANKDRSPEEFVNPFVKFQMIDCRDISTEYGVVFISHGLGIESDYLAYAPEREDKRMQYLRGRKFGEDWYSENTGSQWDRDLFNCVARNKSPNS